MTIEKEDTTNDNVKEKFQSYQNLKEQYLTPKQELKNNNLEQKSLADPDSRRMKNNGSLDICYNMQPVVDSQNHFIIDICIDWFSNTWKHSTIRNVSIVIVTICHQMIMKSYIRNSRKTNC